MLRVGLPAQRNMVSCYCGHTGMWLTIDIHLQWTPEQAPVYINGMLTRCCVFCQDKLQSWETSISWWNVDWSEVWMRTKRAGRGENFSYFIMPEMMLNKCWRELEHSLLVHQCKGCTSDSSIYHFWPSSVVWWVKDVWLIKMLFIFKHNFWKGFLRRQLMMSPCSATVTRLMFQV